MDHFVRVIEAEMTRKDQLPHFRPGDVIRVYEKLGEGTGEGKERLMPFEGVVLKKAGSGSHLMITVRKVAAGIGVERVFPLHSPRIAKVELIERGKKVRRARPYYLRREYK